MWEAWTLKKETIKTEEERLRDSVRKLSATERAEYFRLYSGSLKDPDTYAVLNWFFLAGIHHFYLGKFARGAVNLVIMAIGFAALLVFPVLGVAIILGVIIMELPALFRSQIIVANYNNEIGFRILQSLKAAEQKV